MQALRLVPVFLLSLLGAACGPTYATGGTTPYEMKDSRDTWYSKERMKNMMYKRNRNRRLF